MSKRIAAWGLVLVLVVAGVPCGTWTSAVASMHDCCPDAPEEASAMPASPAAEPRPSGGHHLPAAPVLDCCLTVPSPADETVTPSTPMVLAAAGPGHVAHPAGTSAVPPVWPPGRPAAASSTALHLLLSVFRI